MSERVALDSADEAGGLKGQVVAITGASRGLGAALARAFAARGARVSLCARSGDRVQEIAQEIRDGGGQAYAAAVDVTDPTAVADWVQASAREIGAPSVLINNASLLGLRVPLLEEDLDDWRRTLDVNLTGGLITARAVLPAMLEAGRGSIIQVSSGAANVPRTLWGAYSVSKLAADGMALNLAAELKDTGVRVNVVDPGAMRTSMRAAAYPDEDPLTLKTPEETVEVFLWLASDEAAGVTGKRFLAESWREER